MYETFEKGFYGNEIVDVPSHSEGVGAYYAAQAASAALQKAAGEGGATPGISVENAQPFNVRGRISSSRMRSRLNPAGDDVETKPFVIPPAKPKPALSDFTPTSSMIAPPKPSSALKPSSAPAPKPATSGTSGRMSGGIASAGTRPKTLAPKTIGKSMQALFDANEALMKAIGNNPFNIGKRVPQADEPGAGPYADVGTPEYQRYLRENPGATVPEAMRATGNYEPGQYWRPLMGPPGYQTESAVAFTDPKTGKTEYPTEEERKMHGITRPTPKPTSPEFQEFKEEAEPGFGKSESLTPSVFDLYKMAQLLALAPEAAAAAEGAMAAEGAAAGAAGAEGAAAGGMSAEELASMMPGGGGKKGDSGKEAPKKKPFDVGNIFSTMGELAAGASGGGGYNLG